MAISVKDREEKIKRKKKTGAPVDKEPGQLENRGGDRTGGAEGHPFERKETITAISADKKSRRRQRI